MDRDNQSVSQSGQERNDLSGIDARRNGEWFVANRLCATCYGVLALRFKEGQGWVVECSTYGEEHYGSVGKSYAERRQAEAKLEKREVQDFYGKMLGIQKPNTLSRRETSRALYGEE